MNFSNGSIWRIGFFSIFYYETSSSIKQEVTYFAAMRHFAFFLFPSRFAATESKLDLGVASLHQWDNTVFTQCTFSLIKGRSRSVARSSSAAASPSRTKSLKSQTFAAQIHV